ncbi:MAG: hypothetical protein ACNYPI_12330 [Arenicellales bacterium WSBS_2016_MAG_OTU3]
MNTATKISRIAIATAAASIFAVASIPMSAQAGETIHCVGVNSCKGHSSCKTATSSCKGQNACKGQGFVSVSTEVCDQLGGKEG